MIGLHRYSIKLGLAPKYLQIISTWLLFSRNIFANAFEVKVLCMKNGSKILIYLSFLLFLKDLLLKVMQKERYQSQINQSFGPQQPRKRPVLTFQKIT